MKNIKCPKCGASLQLENEEHSTTDVLTCPVCNENFSLSQSLGEQSKSKYRFGKLYIRLCRFVAVIILILCLAYTIWSLFQTFNKARMGREKLLADAKRESEKVDNDYLLKKLKGVAKTYESMTGLLGTNEFVTLPDSIVLRTIAFPESLASSEDLNKALAELGKIQNDIAEIKKLFSEAIKKNLQALARQNSQTSQTIRRPSSNGTMKMTSGEVIRELYKASFESKLKSFLEEMVIYTKTVASNPEANERTRQEMIKLQQQLNIILNNYISRLGTTISRRSPSAPQTRNNKLKYDFKDELDILSTIPLVITTNFKIDDEIKDFLKELDEAKEHLKNSEDLQRRAKEVFRDTIIEGIVKAIGKFMAELFAVFLILVFADYLNAHFDIADNTHLLSQRL